MNLDSWFHDTVSALAYSFARENADIAQPEFQPPHNDLTRFVLEQHARLPDYLRVPMLAATLGFDLLAFPKGRAPFHKLTPELRARIIAAWKGGASGFQRDLMRYHESLSTLALYGRDVAPAKAATAALADELREQILTQPERELESEIVVIGSGPGGAITACLLAEAGRQVLLLEEGEFLPLTSCVPFSREEMVQKYRNGGQTVALGANKIAYVEGKCVGGGSEINSGLYHRTPPDILETWRAEFQVPGISPADLEPHFAACEHDVSASRLPGPAPAASLKLHEGAEKMGWKSLEVPRWFKYAAGTKDSREGKRQSMTETYIPRFLKAGGRLLPRTRALSLFRDGAHWLIHADCAGLGAIRVGARTLFVCAGAVQTPALLRRSGITRNIGDSLRLHPTIKVAAKFDAEVNAADMGVPVHQVKEFAPRLSFGCSISNPPFLALSLLEQPGAVRAEVSSAWRRMAVYYAMITGQGSGTVRTLPKFRDPLVRYRLRSQDLRDLADGLRKLSELLFASGATALFPGLSGSQPLMTREDLRRLPESLPSGLASLMTIHLFSSCPMGENRSKCAADSFGRVHDYNDLYISDASLLCTAPGVNPQGSIMAIARRNALHFLASNP